MVSYIRPGPYPANAGTTAPTSPDLPNWGVSVISLTSAETFTLQPPEAGVRKTLIWTSSSSGATPIVRGSTAQTVTFDNPGATMMRRLATSTVQTVVEMIGLSSVRWCITSVCPVNMAATLAIGSSFINGSIALSTT